MRYITALLISSFCILNAHATQYDGIYTVPQYVVHRTSPDAPYLSAVEGTVFLTLQEIPDGTIVLTMLNPNTNEWQAYDGTQQANRIDFIEAYSRTDYGRAIVSQEISLEFDEFGNGRFTHTLMAKPTYGRATTIGGLLHDDGRIEVIKNVAMEELEVVE